MSNSNSNSNSKSLLRLTLQREVHRVALHLLLTKYIIKSMKIKLYQQVSRGGDLHVNWSVMFVSWHG